MGGNQEKADNLSPLKRSLAALREMRGKLDATERAKTEPIAVVGMSCRFPGGVDDTDSFWQLLVEGRDIISDVPPDRWDKDRYYDPDPDSPGKTSTTLGGFIEPVDQFDAQFWGLSPREVAAMDPQHRMLLEMSWEALENAGQSPAKLAGSQTGVFIGLSTNDYVWLQLSSGDLSQVDAYMGTGNLFSVSAGRIAYLLGLQGPAMVVDTACSSSLVAAHLACQSLRGGKCSQALVGGVSLILSPIGTIQMSKSRALAEDGRCKTFDAAADGYVRGEGCGMVVLKRLSDAQADGDRVLAVIRGAAVNHDGRSSGLTVPNGQAQKAVIQAALVDAGSLDPNEIDYIEAHGTGTPLGDPIELRALASALVKGRGRDKPLIVGSVKTNIGHTEAAAGVASLIKTVLALQHGLIPKHLHFNTPTPHFEWDENGFEVPTENRPWEGVNGRRLAGVSSFGFSGTNAHIILESAPPAGTEVAPPYERPVHLLALSARDEAALSALAQRYEGFFKSHPDLSLADVAYSANVGRAHFPERLALAAESPAQILEMMEALSHGDEPEGVFKDRAPESGKPKVAFLFTGQGSQYPGMGRELYETHPAFREDIDRCDELLRPHLERPLLSVLFPAESENGLIHNTEYTQPALFALEYALAKLWGSWGITPIAVMGHSIGELAAACVAGVFSLEDGLKLVAERGRLMGSLPANGAMAAVFADEARVGDALRPYAGQLSIAAANGPRNTVISGPEDAVSAVLRSLEAEGIKSKPLRVSHAFHSPLMDPILDPFEAAAASVAFSKPKMRLISNLSGRAADSELSEPAYWRRHIRQPVRFAGSVQALHRLGCTVFLEIGPKPALIHMAQDCLPAGSGVWLASLSPQRSDWRQLLESAAGMYLQGLEVDWAGFDRGYARKKLALPSYPFQRQRYWWKPSPGAARRPAAVKGEEAGGPLLGQRLPSALKEVQYESQVGVHTPSYLGDRVVHKSHLLPESMYVEICLEAGAAYFNIDSPVLEDLILHERLDLGQQELTTLQVILTPEGSRQASVKIYASTEAGPGEESGWRLAASGRLLASALPPAGEPVEPGEISSRMREIDLESWRGQQARLGLERRERFQALEQVWTGDGEALARLAVPQGAGPYYLHPALLDSAFQLAGEGRSSGVLLPVELERVRVFRKAAPVWCRAVSSPSGEERAAGDLFFYDEGGLPAAEVRGLHLSAVRPADLRDAPREYMQWFYDVDWTPRPMPASSSSPGVDGTGSWLILADGGGLGERLARRLEGLGETVKLVYPPTGAMDSVADSAARLDPLDPGASHSLFKTYLARPGKPLRGVVYLWGLDAPPPGDLSVQELESSQLMLHAGLLHTIQALTRAVSEQKDRGAPPRLWVVTRAAQPVAPGQAVLPAQASLWGLGKTAALELPKLFGGLIDLDPDPAGEEEIALLSEITASDDEKQVAYRKTERFAARLVHRTDDLPEGAPLSFRPEAAYLVTGGLGALGLQTARWMAENGARHIVLLSRTALLPRSHWSQAPEDERQAERMAAVKQIEASGASVHTDAVDVGDEAQMDAFLSKYEREGRPPVRGVVHAAGVIRDGSLLQMDLAALREVFRPKISGGWLLHEKLGRGLDFFVLFSSSTSVGGALGQGNYAAANAYLDGLAHYRRSLGEPAISINWGPWHGAGMAARPELEQKRARLGLGGIRPRQGFQVLGRLLYSPLSQIAVIPLEPGRFSALYPAEGSFLSSLEAEQTAEATGSTGEHNVSAGILAASPERRFELSLAHLKKRIARVLMMEPDQVPVERSLMELGCDSIMIMELIRILDRDLQLTLYPREVFEQPTIRSLAGYLAGELERLHGLDPHASSAAQVTELESGGPSPQALGPFLSPSRRNPRIAFLLSSPRSGSTLLRVMLAGHPEIFSPPELHLLPFSSMQARKDKLAGSYLEEGLQRAVMELLKLDAGEARALLEQWDEADLLVQEVYLKLQELAWPRLLVDKSPTYGMEIETLERAEALFEEARYIHLVRHPFAVIDSFVRARLDKLFDNRRTHPARLAEHIWATTTGNTLDFLASIDPERQMLVKYEELVTDPQSAAGEICRFLEIPFDEALLNPYDGGRMTDGPHGKSLSIGDPNFLKRGGIDPSLAEAWKNSGVSLRLGGFARRVMGELGYSLPAPARTPAEHGRKDLVAASQSPPHSEGARLPLSSAQQRMLLLDQIDPGMPTYNIPITIQLSGSLDIPALEKSLNEIITRHTVLRTRFGLKDRRWYQEVDPSPSFTLRALDLQDTPPEARRSKAREILLEEVARPFDLESDLKLRACLLKIEPQVHFLSITLHHIAADGWSLGVLLHELAAHYRAFTAGEPPANAQGSPLPPLPIQYADYAQWQREWLQAGKFEAQTAYWVKQLGQDPPPVLELYTDHPRPVKQTHHGDRHALAFSPELTAALKSLSQREGVTLFMTLLAVFFVLLHRYTGQEDITVGAPVSGRNRPEVTQLIGLFVNTLVMRADLSGKPEFRQFLAQVKRIALEAFENQDIPFEQLIEVLQPERNRSYSPLFQAMFVLQNSPMPGIELPGLRLSPIEDIHTRTAKFDLLLSLTESKTGLGGFIDYNTDLFEPGAMARLASHLQNLLESIVADPQVKITRLGYMSKTEKRKLLVDWNATALDYPKDLCLHQTFEAQVDKTPQAVAVVFEDRSLTYRELDERANRLAAYLKKSGVETGDPVGVCIDRSIEMPVGVMGILKAGGAYVPLDPAYPSDRLEYMIADTGARLVLTQEKLAPSLPASPARVMCIDSEWPEIVKESPERQSLLQNNSGPAYIIYTSGSTGRPKGVQIPHRAAVHFVHAMGQKPGMAPGDILVAVITLSFDMSVFELFAPLAVGARVVIASGEVLSDGNRLADLLAKSGATILQATPTTWQLLLNAGWEGEGRLKAVTGGEALSRGLADRLLSRCGELWNMYGPTEITVYCTGCRIAPGDGRITIGGPVANTRCYILDEEMQVAPVGVVGELYIGGDGLAGGYLNLPELTAQKFVADPFSPQEAARLYRTGDSARWLPDGNIEYLGRKDHQIKIRGFRVEPGEIEAVLMAHPAVREAVIAVREEDPGEKRLVAYAILEAGEAPTVSELRGYMRTKLPDYMLPSHFVFMDAFPLTSSKKIDRKALPAPDQERPDLEKAYTPPQTAEETQLAGLWSELLKVDRIGIHDNFFDLGGHSLLAAQAIERINEIFNVHLHLRSIFDAPTISQILGEVHKAASGEGNGRGNKPDQLDLETALKMLDF